MQCIRHRNMCPMCVDVHFCDFVHIIYVHWTLNHCPYMHFDSVTANITKNGRTAHKDCVEILHFQYIISSWPHGMLCLQFFVLTHFIFFGDILPLPSLCPYFNSTSLLQILIGTMNWCKTHQKRHFQYIGNAQTYSYISTCPLGLQHLIYVCTLPIYICGCVWVLYINRKATKRSFAAKQKRT